MTVFDETAKELQRQNIKWGEQNHVPLYWIGILGEEFGEACKAAIESDLSAYRRELIQIAAVTIAAIECYDRYERKV